MRANTLLRFVVATERQHQRRLAALERLRKMARSVDRHADRADANTMKRWRLAIAIRECSVPLHLVELDGWRCRASMGAILDWRAERVPVSYLVETIDPRTGERITRTRTRLVPAHTVTIIERAPGREPAEIQTTTMPEDAPLRIADPRAPNAMRHPTYRKVRGRRWPSRPDDVRWTLAGSPARYTMHPEAS